MSSNGKNSKPNLKKSSIPKNSRQQSESVRLLAQQQQPKSKPPPPSVDEAVPVQTKPKYSVVVANLKSKAISNCSTVSPAQCLTKPSFSAGQANRRSNLPETGQCSEKRGNQQTNKSKASSSKKEEVACASQSSKHLNNNLIAIQYHSGNPFVEMTKGVLHYYKETQLRSHKDECERSQLILILQVPISMSYNELLQFTGPVNSTIERMRIIRDTRPNQYMGLIKFRNQKSADEFFINFNGVQFNSIESDICNLVYVEKIEVIKDDDQDPKTSTGEDGLDTFLLDLSPDHPTCPVCLEKMDQNADAILTILCNHSFHSFCLINWGDQTCPICRYTQAPDNVSENMCFECGSQQDSLWICITCGHIGCGRYIEGHAYLHFTQTSHNFVMLVGQSNKVWDYAADNYVHRLLQSNDGKPVEVAGNSNEMSEKIDSIQLEYTYLLTNQLESQRKHYEQIISKIEADAQAQIDEVLNKSKILTEEKEKVEAKLSDMANEKERLEKRLQAMEPKYRQLLIDLRDELEMNKCLRENINSVNTRLDEQEKNLMARHEADQSKLNDLNEQIRDLMFALEAENKLRGMEELSTEEIADSKIFVGESVEKLTKTHGKSRRK